MDYFVIKSSLNNDDVGVYPQVVNAEHNCHIWNESKFIDNIEFKRIDFIPITSNAILEKNAKLTDLISSSGIGFTHKLLMSKRLKIILEEFVNDKCQFFESPVIYNNELIGDYFLSHPNKFDIGLIDFEKSKVVLKKRNSDGKSFFEEIKISTIEEFHDILNNKRKYQYKQLLIDEVKLKSNIVDDFLILRHVRGGIKYLVSKRLKTEIENSKCSGIEFMPLEMNITEWLQGGEREKIYGKPDK